MVSPKYWLRFSINDMMNAPEAQEMTDPRPRIDESIIAYYAKKDEDTRLQRGDNRLEFARAKELLLRHMPPTPAVVLDVGGGSGPYSTWLARSGYEVHLTDPVPKHIEQAQEASNAQPDHPIASVREGDARRLEREDESCDAVLLMGPLYRLIVRSDRMRALREAYRVLRPGGIVFAKAISRYGGLIDGLLRSLIDNPDFVRILKRELADGRHLPEPSSTSLFTTAYFHRADELLEEVREAGFTIDDLVAVQGPGQFADNFEELWADPQRRDLLLDLIRTVEHELTMIEMGSHFAVIGHK